MKKFSNDYLVLPEQIDPLQHYHLDPLDAGEKCFSIHVKGRFFMVNDDHVRQAMQYLRDHLEEKGMGILNSCCWVANAVEKPKVFVHIIRIDFVDCINWVEKNNQIVFAKFTNIQDLDSLHEYCLTNIGVESNRGIKLSSNVLFQGDETTAHSFIAYFFDEKGDRIKDLYFYEWFKKRM